MNILIYLRSSHNLKQKNLGGIETLNIQLYKHIKKRYKNTYISINENYKNLIGKKKWDVIISSNFTKIFSVLEAKKNILWLHNHLSIEKSIRKNLLFHIWFNKVTCVFVSRYLEKITSFLFLFNKRKIIYNFLSEEFVNNKINKNRKKIFVYSVNRTKYLLPLIKYWKNSIYVRDEKLKLFIFGNGFKSFNKKKIFELKKYNIFFKGNISKKNLKKYYNISTAMFCFGKDETFCLNALEGVACGLPIICFKNTVLNEILNKKIMFKFNYFYEIDTIIKKVLNLTFKQKKNLIKNCITLIKKYNFNQALNQWIHILKKK